MTNQHPITTPFEMVEEWARMLENHRDEHVFSKIAQWGADAELEACLEWISKQDWTWTKTQLREARRPKPPTLKEQALAALHAVATGANDTREQHQDLDTIRKALEQLNDE